MFPPEQKLHLGDAVILTVGSGRHCCCLEHLRANVEHCVHSQDSVHILGNPTEDVHAPPHPSIPLVFSCKN